MRQIDLFSSVMHAYSAERGGRLSNADLYELVAENAGIPADEMNQRAPIGESGQVHNLMARKIRWHQQTLKHAGILEKVDGARGIWELTQPAGEDLNQIKPTVAVVGFSTDLGIAILGTCEHVFSHIDAPISLVITSPPYPLAKPRAYGGPSEAVYVDWICKTLEPVIRAMAPGASLCLNISNDVFVAGQPARSMYVERVLLALHDRLGLELMDRLVWHNPSKPPGPVQWASKSRVQLNVSYEPVFWLTNDPSRIRSNNQRVLQTHTERHLRLIEKGGETRSSSFSDGAYNVHPGRFGKPTEGRIPRNVLTFGHSCADQREYKKNARSLGLPAHGAPMPLSLASFLVEFLSEPEDLVVDPFGGSFTTAKAAERLGRRWLSSEVMLEYVIGGATRFKDAAGFRQSIAA